MIIPEEEISPTPARTLVPDPGPEHLFYVEAVHDYQSPPHEHLVKMSFRKWDIISVTETKRGGWWKGRLLSTNQQPGPPATFSKDFVALITDEEVFRRFVDGDTTEPLFYVKALYDYNGDQPTDLPFNKNDVISVTATPRDGWWRGYLSNRIGAYGLPSHRHTFPRNFVALISDREKDELLQQQNLQRPPL